MRADDPPLFAMLERNSTIPAAAHPEGKGQPGPPTLTREVSVAVTVRLAPSLQSIAE
jgi:hypothetical protein